MRKRYCYAIEIILSSIIVMLVAIGCKPQSSVPTETSTGPSQYPADIIGHVTVAGFLAEHGAVFTPPNNESYWVVDIVFTNNGYELPDISSYDHWNIVAGDKYYWIPELLKMDKLPLLAVPVGQTEKKVVCFQVPSSLKLSDARLYYQAQKIVSFGPLTGGEKAAGYDWDLKTMVNK